MSVVFKISNHDNDEVDFSQESGGNPLIATSLSNERIHPRSDNSKQKINITLSGYFTGDSHHEIVQTYKRIITVLKSAKINLLYTSNGEDVINREVFVESYSEPSDWKEYLGDYSISMYYYKNSDDISNKEARFDSSQGSYVFKNQPKMVSSLVPMRAQRRRNRYSESGGLVSSAIQIKIEGEIHALNHQELILKIDELYTAYSDDGIFTYGSFTKSCRVINVDLPDIGVLETFANYTITMEYDSGAIIREFDSQVRISRLHGFPVIRERPFCPGGIPFISVQSTGGQYINYSISLETSSNSLARSLLATEVSAIVFPGGIEMPSGTENWTCGDKKVELNFTKYYYPPVIANIG